MSLSAEVDVRCNAEDKKDAPKRQTKQNQNAHAHTEETHTDRQPKYAVAKLQRPNKPQAKESRKKAKKRKKQKSHDGKNIQNFCKATQGRGEGGGGQRDASLAAGGSKMCLKSWAASNSRS